MSDSNDEQSLTAGPISRRKVLSTAGKAAWAVPVITMASAVPAFAASTSGFTLDSATPTAVRSGGGQSPIFIAQVTAHETNNVAGTATLHVTIVGATTITKVSMTGGWVLVSTSGNTAILTRAFAPGGSVTAALTFTASPSVNVPTVSLSIT